MSENSSKSSKGKSGNTRQISPAKHWVFTFNNYTEQHIDSICSNSSIKRYSFQEETGESGTPHLQGYIEFLTKKRPHSVFPKDLGIHWEKCKRVKEAIAYTQKEDTRTGKVFTKNIPKIRKIKCLSNEQLYKWQKEVVNMVSEEPDDRSVHWYWEDVGNVGKSALVRYLVIRHNAILISGKGADIKYQIKQYVDTHGYGPECILYDIPRTAENYINYTAIEEIKNGLFASNKYESSMIVMNPPHLICFANFEPNYGAVSQDRWKVTNLGEDS